MEVKYTDVDYSVFVEGARSLQLYGTPYNMNNRLGYKYTPVLGEFVTFLVSFDEH